MSLNKSLKLISILFAGLLFGFSLSSVISKFTTGSTQFASSNQSNMNKYPEFLIAQRKHLRFADINIFPTQELPESGGDIVELVAQITLIHSAKNEIKYRWILPNQTKLVSGSLEGSLGKLNPHILEETTIKVENLSREQNELVIFEVNEEDSNLGTSQVFATRPEDTQEALAPLRTQSVREFKEKEIEK